MYDERQMHNYFETILAEAQSTFKENKFRFGTGGYLENLFMQTPNTESFIDGYTYQFNNIVHNFHDHIAESIKIFKRPNNNIITSSLQPSPDVSPELMSSYKIYLLSDDSPQPIQSPVAPASLIVEHKVEDMTWMDLLFKIQCFLIPLLWIYLLIVCCIRRRKKEQMLIVHEVPSYKITKQVTYPNCNPKNEHEACVSKGETEV
jgi:hypothetical protein